MDRDRSLQSGHNALVWVTAAVTSLALYTAFTHLDEKGGMCGSPVGAPLGCVVNPVIDAGHTVKDALFGNFSDQFENIP